MKYVAEITDLMAAFPGRDFKMAEIVRYVAGGRKSLIEKKQRPCGALSGVQFRP